MRRTLLLASLAAELIAADRDWGGQGRYGSYLAQGRQEATDKAKDSGLLTDLAALVPEAAESPLVLADLERLARDAQVARAEERQDLAVLANGYFQKKRPPAFTHVAPKGAPIHRPSDLTQLSSEDAHRRPPRPAGLSGLQWLPARQPKPTDLTQLSSEDAHRRPPRPAGLSVLQWLPVRQPKPTDLTQLSSEDESPHVRSVPLEASSSLLQQDHQASVRLHADSRMEGAGSGPETLFEDAPRTRLFDSLHAADASMSSLVHVTEGTETQMSPQLGVRRVGKDVPSSLLATASSSLSGAKAKEEALGLAADPGVAQFSGQELQQQRQSLQEALQAVLATRERAEAVATNAAESLTEYSHALKQLRDPLQGIVDEAAGLQSRSQRLVEEQTGDALRALQPLPAVEPQVEDLAW